MYRDARTHADTAAVVEGQYEFAFFAIHGFLVRMRVDAPRIRKPYAEAGTPTPLPPINLQALEYAPRLDAAALGISCICVLFFLSRKSPGSAH